MKRGYLLPEGCKDLIDVFRSSLARQRRERLRALERQKLMERLRVLHGLIPPIVGEIKISGPMRVEDLASALKQQVARIMIDVMELEIFVPPQVLLGHQEIAWVALKYGYIVRKSD